jgi:hypothetical protein
MHCRSRGLSRKTPSAGGPGAEADHEQGNSLRNHHRGAGRAQGSNAFNDKKQANQGEQSSARIRPGSTGEQSEGTEDDTSDAGGPQ